MRAIFSCSHGYEAVTVVDTLDAPTSALLANFHAPSVLSEDIRGTESLEPLTTRETAKLASVFCFFCRPDLREAVSLCLMKIVPRVYCELECECKFGVYKRRELNNLGQHKRCVIDGCNIKNMSVTD